jgi:endonuclease/exonuclease/phosphatase family metal-dependent hydrolase
LGIVNKQGYIWTVEEFKKSSPQNITLMKAKKLLWLLLLLPVLYIAGVILHGTVVDFQPVAVSDTLVSNPGKETPLRDSVLSFAIWNIGYAGLGEESDFFYEKGSLLSAGSMVRPTKALMEKNWAGIQQYLQTTKTDFWLLQEVDYESKRSYSTNQFKGIEALFPDYFSSYAVNYKVGRVPVPVLEPWKVYGKVNSGLASFTRFQPTAQKRLQLPGNYSWPTRIFMLDRCAAMYRFPHINGKELVVFNIHNSAYDDGSLKAQQMSFLKDLFLEEYGKGNYVIAGGDWNQCPPFFKADSFISAGPDDYVPMNIDPEALPVKWQWVYDPTTPSNRKVSEPFSKGNSFVTLIDFFLVSPNLKVKSVKGINLDFQYSDHQPVWMEVELL